MAAWPTTATLMHPKVMADTNDGTSKHMEFIRCSIISTPLYGPNQRPLLWTLDLTLIPLPPWTIPYSTWSIRTSSVCGTTPGLSLLQWLHQLPFDHAHLPNHHPATFTYYTLRLHSIGASFTQRHRCESHTCPAATYPVMTVRPYR